MFTRQHYNALAQCLKDAQWNQNIEAKMGIERVAHLIADMFERDNPNFRRDLFLNAAFSSSTQSEIEAVKRHRIEGKITK